MGYFKAGLIKEGEKILIYDFGGGTFDASLLGCNRGEFHSLAEPAGLEHCGGIDIDRMIYEDMLRKLDPDMLALVNQKPINRMRLDSQLAELAVKAKHHLSSAKNFSEDIQIGFELVPYSLSREALEEMLSPMAGQTISVCRSLLKNAGLEASDLSAILMVGGTSRIPLVQTAVAQLAKNVPVLASIDLELAVASGALGFEQKPPAGTSKSHEAAAADIKAQGKATQEKPAAGTSKKQGKTAAAVKEPSGPDSDPKKKGGNILPQLCAPDVDRRAALLKSSGTVLFPNDDLFYMDSDHQRQIKTWTDIVQLCGQDCLVPAECFLMGLRKDGTIMVEIQKDESKMCDVSGWHDIARIACGEEHTVGLKKDGTVVAVGNNDDGQCKCDVSRGWRDIIKVAAGDYHTVGLKKDGTAVAVGRNYRGQCNVSGWTNIVDIACGDFITVGLRSDGTVIAAGENEYGQCDLIRDWKDICAVFVNNMHTFGLRKDGAILMTDFGLKNKFLRRYSFNVINKRTTILKEKWF